MANSVDADQTPRVAASDQGLHCLLRHVYPNSSGKFGAVNCKMLFHIVIVFNNK